MNEEVKTPNNSEIEQALKEFEVKSAEQQTGSYKAVKFYDETDAPKMVRLVMKYSGGAIKEQKTAEYVLLGLVIIMFAVSLYLFFGGGGNSSQKPDAVFLEQVKNMQQAPVNK